MLPAQQRLEAAQPLARQRDDRLIVQTEFLALDRAAQIGLDQQPLLGGRQHRDVEDLAARLAEIFGAIHRRVGVAHHVLRPVVARVGHHDADARRHRHLAALQLKRLRDDRRQPLGDRARIDDGANAGEEDRELVAAEPRHRALAVEPGHRVGAPQRLLEPA